MKYPVQDIRFTFGTIRISLSVPDEKAIQEINDTGTVSVFPFWSRPWASSLALADFLHRHSFYIENKKVLEIAAGLGLPSLLAAAYARSVIASDLSAEAVELIRRSAALSGISNLEAKVIDWNNSFLFDDADVLLLSDVNYAPEDFEQLYGIIRQSIQHHATVILATPYRLQAKPFMERLLEWRLSSTEFEVEKELIAVWVMGI